MITSEETSTSVIEFRNGDPRAAHREWTTWDSHSSDVTRALRHWQAVYPSYEWRVQP